METQNKLLKLYLQSVSKALGGLIDKHSRDRILSDLKTNVGIYLEENPGARLEEVTEVFGTPGEIAASYAEEAPKRNRNKKRLIILIPIAVVVLGALLLWQVLASAPPDANGGQQSQPAVSTSADEPSGGSREESGDSGTESAVSAPSAAPTPDPYAISETETSFYILPESYKTRLTDADVEGMDKKTLSLARNEIYARHGRKFLDADLQAYFNGQGWYTGTVEPEDFDPEIELNQTEQRNIIFLQRHENR